MGKEDTRYEARHLAMEPGREAGPARPVLSASIILARPAGQGFEVLLVRRGEGTDFARSAFVFPGGRVDPADRGTALQRPSPEEALALLSRSGPGAPTDPAEARAVWAAAVRELEEETGLGLPADRLRYFSRWITPEALPRRFDTHFFLAPAPEAGRVRLNPAEHSEGRWLSPRAALRGHKRGETPMVFPTLRQMEGLARFESHEALLAFGDRRRVTATTLPRLVEEEGRRSMLVPPDPDGLW